jgi:hypothetical protein
VTIDFERMEARTKNSFYKLAWSERTYHGFS